MKKLLILPFLVLLTGCVTYYYPQTALKDGVYYAEDDPSYVISSGAAYYPWHSLDYFYLGYHPYPWYGFYPYYYRPYYSAYYPYYPAWRPGYGHCSYYNGCYGDHRNYRGTGRDRYAGGGNNDVGSRSDERGFGGEPPVYYNSRQAGGGDVRYRSGAKETRSRTGPVETSGPSKGITVNTQPPPHGTSSRQTRSAPPSRSNNRSHSRPPPSASSSRSRGTSTGKSSPPEHLD